MAAMGQWQEVQRRMEEMDEMDKKKFSQSLALTYRQYGIPLDIRNDMAHLIESMCLDNIDPKEEEIKGREIYEKIIAELLNLMKNRQFPHNVSLQNKVEEIQNRFRENPGELVRNLKNCLVFEKLLIASINQDSEVDMERGQYMEGSMKIAESMSKIRHRSDQFEMMFQQLQTKTACFLKFYLMKEERCAKINKAMQGNETEDKKRDYLKEKQMLEHGSEQETLSVYKSRKESQELLVQLYDDVIHQVKEVWKYLDLYEKQQKLNMLDIRMGPPEGAVKDLNDMCEAVNEMLIRLVQYFDLVMDECKRIKIVDDPTPDILVKHQTLFVQEAEKHFNRIVVIDHHPNQILKISKGRSLTFAMTLRILGPVSLGLNVNIPTVTANLHQEKDLPGEMIPSQEVSKGICLIHNASNVKAQYKASTKQLMVNFSSAQITSVKRPESRSRDERVTEMKYGMIFSVRLNIGGQARLIKKLSLPMILTSQSSQEWAAKGTLFWDAYFSDERRQYFQDAPKVYWEQVADLMDRIFKGHTKRGLTKEQLSYLAQRVFGPHAGSSMQEDISKVIITKEKFLKESLLNTNFSLWKWVYACLNLIKESLGKEWEKGLIMGFVSRERANALLQNCPAGTFLLRFGTTKLHETQSATITAILAPVAVIAVPGGNRVSHMDANLTQQKLARYDLARYLQLLQIQDPQNKDIKRQALATLYPNIPFDEAFKDLLHASELSNENYDPIIDKPEIVPRDFDNHMAMSPASPDSSVTSGASICQEDNIFMPPCATIPEMGGGNDENDLDRIDEATVAPSVEEIVPTLRISTSDGLAYALQSPALQTEANSCSGPFSGASHSLDHTLDHTLDQGIGVKRKCVTNSNSNRMEGFTTSSFSGIHMQMPQALMSNPRFYGNMGNIQNSNMNNMNRSQATAHDPHRLPSYSDHTGSSPSYMNQYNSGPVFPPQVGYEPMSGPPSVNTQMGNMQLQHDIVGNPQVGNPQVCSSSHSNSTQMVSSNSQPHMSNPQMSGPSFADPQMTNTQLSNTLMSSQQVSSPTYVNNPLLGKNQHLNNPQMGGQQMGSSQMGSQQMGSQQMGSPQMSSPQPLSSPVLGNLLLGGQQGSHMSPYGNNKTDDALFSTQQALLAQKQAAVSSTTDNVSPHM